MPQVWWYNSEASHENYGSLGKNVAYNDMKGQVKGNHISPEKCHKIQTKDYPYSPWLIYKHRFFVTFAILPEK